jgi:tetratricopeptide (TPR) repeat protein
MAPRANWKGYLRLSLVSCPIALYPASSVSEKVSFNRINRKTGNRLKQQNVDSETGEIVSPAAPHAIEIEQPGGRTDKRGQFVLPVSRPEQDADALFDQAQSAEEAGDLAKAERLYRLLMKCDPTDAAPPFNLGNMLRANGRKVEAEAALRAATWADPAFAEAWYNLSDLLDEQGQSEAAIDCLRRALHAAPDYADAMFNLALLLQRNNKHAEAAENWRRYLANEAKSEWAARARRCLKFCEMQIHLSAF